MRLDAYAAFHEHAFATWNWLGRIYANPHLANSSLAEEANRELTAMISVSGRVSIVGPDSVDERLEALSNVVHDVTVLIRTPGGFDNSTEWEQTSYFERYKAAEREFVLSTRAALGLKDASTGQD